MECEKHNIDKVYKAKHQRWHCNKCNQEWVANRRRFVKRAIVEKLGGRCVLCGYDRCIGALHLHHVNPKTKTSNISNWKRSLTQALAEAKKCVLLCANCHTEVEMGMHSGSVAEWTEALSS